LPIEDKIEKKSAPLLFNLAELHNSCTKKFKITPNQTLEIAQSLYEKQITTYPRTDARYLSTAVCKEIDKNLTGLKSMGNNQKFIEQILTFWMYSGIESTKYCNDSKITDHDAIIPTGQGDVSGLSDLELAVYQMIVDRFICIFMPQAEFNTSTAIPCCQHHQQLQPYCAGCYSRCNDAPQDTEPVAQLSDDEWLSVFDEASDLGVSFILLAGGEPLLRKGVIESAGKKQDILFPIFTN